MAQSTDLSSAPAVIRCYMTESAWRASIHSPCSKSAPSAANYAKSQVSATTSYVARVLMELSTLGPKDESAGVKIFRQKALRRYRGEKKDEARVVRDKISEMS